MVRLVLSEEEMGTIALAYVRRKIRQDSISLNAEKLRREIGNTAKDIGVPPEKALQFTCQILEGAFRDVMMGLSK